MPDIQEAKCFEFTNFASPLELLASRFIFLSALVIIIHKLNTFSEMLVQHFLIDLEVNIA